MHLRFIACAEISTCMSSLVVEGSVKLESIKQYPNRWCRIALNEREPLYKYKLQLRVLWLFYGKTYITFLFYQCALLSLQILTYQKIRMVRKTVTPLVRKHILILISEHHSCSWSSFKNLTIHASQAGLNARNL